MPWWEVSTVDQRREFVALASAEGANRRELCRRFGISAQTGYKWLSRSEQGERSMKDRSRRPHSSPLRSADAIEASVLAIRDAHPPWGARKAGVSASRVSEIESGTKPGSVTALKKLARSLGIGLEELA